MIEFKAITILTGAVTDHGEDTTVICTMTVYVLSLFIITKIIQNFVHTCFIFLHETTIFINKFLLLVVEDSAIVQRDRTRVSS